jgi:prepilin-type N-terminal cleavage/methylation domain-containing protein
MKKIMQKIWQFFPQEDYLFKSDTILNASGFSLIELIIVLGLISFVSTISMASYYNYNGSRLTSSATSDIITFLNTAKSNSISQVKPLSCITSNQTLNGYKVKIITPNTYNLYGVCNNSDYFIVGKKLPANVTFINSTPDTFLFTVSSGTVATPVTIKIAGGSITKTIIVSISGIISVQ